MTDMATAMHTVLPTPTAKFPSRWPDWRSAQSNRPHAKKHKFGKMHGKELWDLFGLITKHLKKGERVKIAGLGILRGA